MTVKRKKVEPMPDLPPEDVPFDDVLRQVLRAPAHHKATAEPKKGARSKALTSKR